MRFLNFVMVGLVFGPHNFVASSNVSASEENPVTGAALYEELCLTCHQADGGGVPTWQPTLRDGYFTMGPKKDLIKFVMEGTVDQTGYNEWQNVMPNFSSLEDDELANVLTYIRSNFGNKGSAVSVEDVKKQRPEPKQQQIDNPAAESPAESTNEADVDEEITVVSMRLPTSKSDQAYAISSLSGEQLQSFAGSRLDEKLSQVPGFSLFRRNSSRVAHPTTQGVTLRSIGPNGAGRTLVLLDGIPQNDPFGGWINWSNFNTMNFDQVDIIKGAGAGRWGSGALAGTLSLHSTPITQSESSLAVNYGSFGTVEASIDIKEKREQGFFFANASYFESDGYYLLDENQRGVADEKAASEARSVNFGGGLDLSNDTTLILKAGFFQEGRVNGLILSANDMDVVNLSASFVKQADINDISWQVNAYYKEVKFANSFASVDALRETSRMVLDQFDVPGSGLGLNGLVRIPLGQGHVVETGFDGRSMKGETNERYRNLGAGFTRERLAGGEQVILGAYVEYINTVFPDLVLTAGARVDHWKTSNGIRLETNTENNTVVRSDVIENQSDKVFNGRAGFSYRVSPMVSLRGAVYSGFRLPSINEFYRPFRVRNDITESNPTLVPEKTKGIDIGFDYVANETTTLSAGFFVNHLENGVGNVTLALGPGFFPPTGFVPAGGSLRQRQNIDKIKAQGIEVQFSTEIGNGFSLDAGYIHSNTKVTKFIVDPTLEGKRLAQSPSDVLAVSLSYEGDGPFKISGGLKHTSNQFDDDQNVRVLPNYTLVNIVARYKMNDQISLFASAQNLLDENYLTALSGAGLMTIGQPRTLALGIRGLF